MAKPRKIDSETRAKMEVDLKNGMTRGDMKLKYKVSYAQIAAEFGNAWKKKPAITIEQEVKVSDELQENSTVV